MEKFRNGHEESPIKRKALGEIRGALETLRNSLGERESEDVTETVRPRRPKALRAIATAAALEFLARRLAAEPVRPRRKRPRLLTVALLSAAVLVAGKLIAGRR